MRSFGSFCTFFTIDNLRGCLRIMVRLKNRGLKSQARGPNDDLNVEDQLSSDLIRFVPVIVFLFFTLDILSKNIF